MGVIIRAYGDISKELSNITSALNNNSYLLITEDLYEEWIKNPSYKSKDDLENNGVALHFKCIKTKWDVEIYPCEAPSTLQYGPKCRFVHKIKRNGQIIGKSISLDEYYRKARESEDLEDYYFVTIRTLG